MRKTTFYLCIILCSLTSFAESIEWINFGDFNSWITRNISESSIIGGNKKTLYEIGPAKVINGNVAYSNGKSPWGTSNVYAKVKGVVKGSNAVYPAVRSGNNKCAKLCSQMEHVKVIGLFNMEVMVAGSIFLGQMIEPITSTSNPYSKMIMGVPYTKRPKALVFDYKVDMPSGNTRTKATGFSKKKTLQGHDQAVVFVMLQSRWEDEKGNLHASRVATAVEKFGSTTNWVNGHKLHLVYGDCSNKAGFRSVGLRVGSNAYYAKNSKGKMRPVVEEKWDANAVPTHIIVMMSAGNGEPYVGTEGLTFYVDNVGFKL